MSYHHSRRGVQAVRAEATPDPKAVLAELRDRFQNFKSRYDGRHDEIDKLGARLPAGGGGALPGRVDARALAEFFAAVRKRDVSPSEVAGEDLSGYAAAMGSWFRRGDAVTQDVRAAMQVGSDPDGGFWVHPTLVRDIRTRLYETSPMRSVAAQLTISSDHVAIPIDNNDLVTGGWVGETASRPETATSQIAEQKIFLREQYCQPAVTQKLLDMSSFDVETWLGRKIADKLARDENTAFVTGTGVNEPRGWLDYKGTAVTTDDDSRSWGVVQYVPSGASGGFPDVSGIPGAKDADALSTLKAKLKPAYLPGAVFAMNRSTLSVVRTLKDGDGRWLVQTSLAAGQPDTLLGHPIVLMEDMPDVSADSFSVAFGNFMEAYQIVDGPGLRILRDPFTSEPYVRFYTTKWTGGDLVNSEALKLMKFAAS